MKTHLKEKYVIGIGTRTSNAEAAKTIPEHWQRFQNNPFYNKIERVSNDIYAVYTNYEGDHTKPYTLIVGFEVPSLDNVPSDLMGVTIPSSNYEIFSAKGIFPPIYQTWQKIWQTPLKRTYKADFEFYPENLKDQVPPEVLIYIGVE